MFCHPEHTMVTKTSHYKNQAHWCLPCFKPPNKEHPLQPVGSFTGFQNKVLPQSPSSHLFSWHKLSWRKSRSISHHSNPSSCQAGMQRAAIPHQVWRTRAARKRPWSHLRVNRSPNTASGGRNWAELIKDTFLRNGWFLYHLHTWRSHFLTLRATENTSLCWSIWVCLDRSQQEMGHSGISCW